AINKLTRPFKRVAILDPSPGRIATEPTYPELFRQIGEYAYAERMLPFAANDYRVAPRVDTLVVINPRNITDGTVRSINEHVMRGKPLVAVMDGMVAMTGNTLVPNSSKIIPMLRTYGVEV